MTILQLQNLLTVALAAGPTTASLAAAGSPDQHQLLLASAASVASDSSMHAWQPYEMQAVRPPGVNAPLAFLMDV
jgi:hypothetical protein